MRKRMVGLLVVLGLAALLGEVPLATAESHSLDIYPGQDLAAVVNGDPAATATTFYVHGQNGDPYTYNVNATLRLNTGDKLVGDAGTFLERGPAFDPQPLVNIVGGANVSNVVRAEGTVHLEWVKIVGGAGQYSGGSPVAGSGSAVAMGKASGTSSLYAVHVTGSDAAGITNAQGTFDRIELDNTTQDMNFLGFTGAGLKAINEVEVSNSYVHDNQGNGLWCDEFCHDSASHPNGFWIHDNLVVKNGRSGIRFERVGDVSTAGEALIEHNAVHGNSTGAARGGVRIHDAQNALVRNNVFGATTVAGVSYSNNSTQLAVSATDSGRAARPDLWNVNIVGNVLNDETIEGCELPDTVVACSGHTPETIVDSGPAGAVNSTSASLKFSSSEASSAFECSLDAAPFAECASPREYADLLDGEHTFEVKATNAVGSDPTPARHTWTVDTVAPEAPAITSPEDNSRNNTGSVALSGTAEPGSTVEIIEDTVSRGTTLVEAGGTWSVALSKVPNGSHTYKATATDGAANASPPSNTRTVIVDVTPSDTVAPRVISAVPKTNATGVSPAANVAATFSEDMLSSSVNGTTFKLFKKGSATKLSAAITYSADTDTATLDAVNPLRSGVVYKAVVTTGVKDLAGNQLDQNGTATGLQQEGWFFTAGN